jgi:hypothetical protein
LVAGSWHVMHAVPEDVDAQYRALGAVRSKSEVRSKTAAWASVKLAPTVDPILAAEMMNSRLEIMPSFLCYDSPGHYMCQSVEGGRRCRG